VKDKDAKEGELFKKYFCATKNGFKNAEEIIKKYFLFLVYL
jgi:hypothetical protein